ncbi:aldehyde dehydrogenase family protein [Mucilaginibacter sp.]|uniref:aldehyde dehydrogenase family protein n=1 Tax=Mucilaginibacter sp. TaxID=1882438 RepID=UPI0035BC1966
MEKYTNLNKQYIDGAWKDGTENVVIDNLNPFSDVVIHSMNSAGHADVDEAFSAAKNASSAWADSNPLFKRDILLKAADILWRRKNEFIEWLALETGSTYIKAFVETQQARDILIEAASFPTRMHGTIQPSTIDGKESFIYRKPLGVIALISPWNFPLYLSMRTIAPSLGTGNTVVVKPATQSLVTGGTLIAKVLEEAGLPAGVLNVVIGKSDIIGDYFTGHPVSKMVSFTGSTPVGRGIGKIAGEQLKKSALELGGNNVFIVLDDADVDYAVEAAIFGRFLHQGQACISVNRIMIHDSLYEDFKEKFVAMAKELPHGDALDPVNIIGPVIDHKALQRILGVIARSQEAGAIVECGNLTENNILLPTVLSGVTETMPIFQEEIFGPAVGLVSFKDDDEAVTLANATDFGLSGAIHTKDVYRAMQLSKRIKTGMMHINDQTANDEIHAPFGGEKSSGTGRFGGNFILDELTTVQWVSVQYQTRQYPF